MANPLRSQILKDIVEPAIKASKTAIVAEVIRYNSGEGTINVRSLTARMVSDAGDENLTGDEIIQNITVVNSTSFKDESLNVGDRVYIDFINDDKSKAIVLNVIKSIDWNTYMTGATQTQSVEQQVTVTSIGSGPANLGGGVPTYKHDGRAE